MKPSRRIPRPVGGVIHLKVKDPLTGETGCVYLPASATTKNAGQIRCVGAVQLERGGFDLGRNFGMKDARAGHLIFCF